MKVKVILKQNNIDVNTELIKSYKNPSYWNCPVLVMSPPCHTKAINNNVWMNNNNQNGKNNNLTEINHDKFLYEWKTLYEVLSQEAIIFLLPPTAGLGDLVYVNSFAYLPHIKEQPTCIISRFRAKGRQGEEKVAKEFLTQMGYVCYQPPQGMYFEGEPELKYLREKIYIGSYGVRGTKTALEWIESNFDCEIIKIGLETETLYHGDCLFFPITPYDILVAINHVDKKELKKLENLANIIPIEDEQLLEFGIMNSISIGYTVYTADNELAWKTQEEKEIERKKRQVLCQIVGKLGMEVIFIELTEALKQGALCSCFVSRLNYVDKEQIIMWKEGKQLNIIGDNND